MKTSWGCNKKMKKKQIRSKKDEKYKHVKHLNKKPFCLQTSGTGGTAYSACSSSLTLGRLEAARIGCCSFFYKHAKTPKHYVLFLRVLLRTPPQSPSHWIFSLREQTTRREAPELPREQQGPFWLIFCHFCNFHQAILNLKNLVCPATLCVPGHRSVLRNNNE